MWLPGEPLCARPGCRSRHSAGNPSSENREWWRKLVREVRRTHSSKVGLVWMLDANGKVRSHDCNAIGSCAAEKENDNGLMLREAPMEFDMFLPATFGECAEDENDQWTWISTFGTTHLLRPLWTLPQCALIIDLWHATSLWVMEKVASGMIGDSVDMIGMRCNLMKRVRGFGQCCSTLSVLTGLLKLTHIWHVRMHASYTLHGNVLRNSASRRKRLGFLITRWNSFNRSAPPCECGRNFDASGVGVRCKESLCYGELCKVAKSPFSCCKCGKRECVPCGASLQTKRRCHVFVLS